MKTINMQAELEKFNALDKKDCYALYTQPKPAIMRLRHFASLDAAEAHMSKLGVTVAEFKWFLGFDADCEKAPWVVFTGMIQDFFDGKCTLEVGKLSGSEYQAPELKNADPEGEPIVIHVKASEVKIPERKSVSELLAENGEKVEIVEKPKAPKITVAGVMRCLIFAGFSNGDIWKICQNVFDLEESKISWPSWFRSEIRRKSIDASKFELGKYWQIPDGLLEFLNVQKAPVKV